MTLTDEHVAEFQMLWRKNLGQDITKEQALEKGLRLIRLIEVVSKHEAKKREWQGLTPKTSTLT